MAKKNNPKKNGNKRPGLSCREMQILLEMTRYRQMLRRLQGTPRNTVYGSATERAAKIVDDQQKRSVVVKVYTKEDTKRFKDRRRAFGASQSEILASRLVENSSRSVLQGLGIKLFEMPSDLELAHTVGRLVADRAVNMATGLAAILGPGGRGGRMGAGGLIDSIGSTGLEVEISPTGAVSALVTPKSPARKSRKSKPTKAASEADPATCTPLKQPPTKNQEEEIKVGHKSVVKHSNGNTTIIIRELNVYIKVVQNDTMIISPKTVNYEMAKHEPQFLSAIESKQPDEVKEDEDEDK